MIFEPFGHGNNNSTPTGDENGNILGLELEIATVFDYDGLNNAFLAGVIEAENSPSAAPIQIEYEEDPNNELEIVFNADEQNILLSRLREFNSFTAGDFETFEGSSAHIHLNRAFIYNIGLSESDILKAVEAIAPVLYRVSGRDRYYWDRWSEEHIDISRDYVERLHHVDELRPYYGDRYQLLNLTNNNTLEIRGFSNYCNFDPKHINLFLGMAGELVINIAYDMCGLSYSRDGLEIITRNLSEFFEADAYSWAVDYFNLNKFLDVERMRRRYARTRINNAVDKYEYNKRGYINRLRRYINEGDRVGVLHSMADAANAGLYVDYIDLINPADTADALELANARQFLAALF